MSSDRPDRRTIILDTVIRLIADHGLVGVTHRAVDSAAGLPQRSSNYYFSKKADLLRAAAEHLAHELEKDCDGLQIAFAETAARQGIEAAIEYFAQGLIATTDQTRHLLLARIELSMAAARDPNLAGVGDLLATAARRPIEFFIGLVFQGRQTFPLATSVALIDGVSLMYAIGQGPQPTAEQVTAVLRSLAAE